MITTSYKYWINIRIHFFSHPFLIVTDFFDYSRFILPLINQSISIITKSSITLILIILLPNQSSLLYLNKQFNTLKTSPLSRNTPYPNNPRPSTHHASQSLSPISHPLSLLPYANTLMQRLDHRHINPRELSQTPREASRIERDVIDEIGIRWDRLRNKQSKRTRTNDPLSLSTSDRGVLMNASSCW